MPLQILEISKTSSPDPALMEALGRTHLYSFLSAKVYATVYPGSESTHAAIIAKNVARHTASISEDPTAHIVVAIDPELSDNLPGQVIAFIKYNIYESSKEKLDQTDAEEKREWPPGTNVAFAEEFWAHLVDARKRYGDIGPHVFVDYLATAPEHHRRGAGRMLMEHAIGVADQLELPAMLEGSPAGAKLYMSCGFVPIAEFWSDLLRYENGGDKGEVWAKNREPGIGEGWSRMLIMKRPLRGEVVESDFKLS